jgi:transcriptional regulator with XRE-family HTH domain
VNSSSSTLLGPKADLLDCPLQFSEYAFRFPLAFGNLADVLGCNAKLSGDLAEDPVDLGGLGQFGKGRLKLYGQGIPREYESDSILTFIKRSRGKSVPSVKKGVPAFAERIKALRARLGMNQTAFAKAVGAGQGAVSKWEKGESKPYPDTFIQIARLTDDTDKFFFLDLAGVPEEYFEGSPMASRLLQVTTEMVAESMSDPSGTLEGYRATRQERSVPVIKYENQLGDSNATVDFTLSLPSSWLPQHSSVQAVRMSETIPPLVCGDLICIVDTSRRDPDRLRGCIVAVRTPNGVAAMKLREDNRTYFLAPLYDSQQQQVRVLRDSGEWSIVGRVLRWIGEASNPESEPAQNTPLKVARRRK